jgi:hypothetical protein
MSRNVKEMSASVPVSQRNGTSSFLTLLMYCVKAGSLYIAWDLFIERLLKYEVVNECELLVPVLKVYLAGCGSS